MPFVGFFYTGIVSDLASKKRVGFGSTLALGFSAYKSLTFWILSFLTSMVMVHLFSFIDLDFMPTLVALGGLSVSLEFILFSIVCLFICFMFVSYLIRRLSLMDAIKSGFVVVFDNLIEILFGLILWSIVIAIIYWGLQWLVLTSLGTMKSFGTASLFFSNLAVVLIPFQGLWIFIAAISWIVFVYNICKTTRA